MLAFAARVAVGLANDGVLHPERSCSDLEQAHRLVFGAGMVPWEYQERPAAMGGVAGARCTAAGARARRHGHAGGLSAGPRGRAQRGEPRGALCRVSVARALFGADAGHLALLVTAFWYELVSYGHRATIDAIVAYVACAALALVFTEPTGAVRLTCGALVGLASVLRFQMAPALAAIALAAAVAGGRAYGWRHSGAWPWWSLAAPSTTTPGGCGSARSSTAWC